MAETEATLYEFGPIERRGLFGMLRPGQVVILGSAAMTSMALLYLAPTLLGGALAAALTAGALFASFVPVAESKTLEQWAAPWARHYWRERTGINAEYGLGAALGITRGARVTPAAQPAAVAGVEWLSFVLDGKEVGVAKDSRRGGYCAALRTRGPSFMLLDEAAQAALLDQFGRVLAMQALEGSTVSRIQIIERTVPDYGDDLRAYADEVRDPALPDDSPIVESYESLLAGAAPASQRHETLLVVRVDGGARPGIVAAMGAGRAAVLGAGALATMVLGFVSLPAAAAAALALVLAGARVVGTVVRSGMEEDRLACVAIAREVSDLRRALHQNTAVVVDDVLGPRSLAWFVRSAFDPAVQAHRRPKDADPGVDGRNAWPTSSEIDKRWWRTDSGLHRTWKIEEFPRRPVPSDWLHPLILGSGVRRTLSIVLKPIPAMTALREAEQAVASEEAEADRRAKAGFRFTARRARQHGSASRREDELVSGHAEYEYAGYLSVTVPAGDGDEEALALASTQVLREAAQCLMDAKVMTGWQDEGFTNTLPLARGLR